MGISVTDALIEKEASIDSKAWGRLNPQSKEFIALALSAGRSADSSTTVQLNRSGYLSITFKGKAVSCTDANQLGNRALRVQHAQTLYGHTPAIPAIKTYIDDLRTEGSRPIVIETGLSTPMRANGPTANEPQNGKVHADDAGSLPIPPDTPAPPEAGFRAAAVEILKAYWKLDEFESTYVFIVKGETQDEIDISLRQVARDRVESYSDVKASYESGKKVLLEAAKSAGVEVSLRNITAAIDDYEGDRRRSYLLRHIRGESDEIIAGGFRNLQPDTVRQHRDAILDRMANILRDGPQPA